MAFWVWIRIGISLMISIRTRREIATRVEVPIRICSRASSAIRIRIWARIAIVIIRDGLRPRRRSGR